MIALLMAGAPWGQPQTPGFFEAWARKIIFFLLSVCSICLCAVQQRKALWGHNLARDRRADGNSSRAF